MGITRKHWGYIGLYVENGKFLHSTDHHSGWGRLRSDRSSELAFVGRRRMVQIDRHGASTFYKIPGFDTIRMSKLI